jgi:hypothetical protein
MIGGRPGCPMGCPMDRHEPTCGIDGFIRERRAARDARERRYRAHREHAAWLAEWNRVMFGKAS